MRMKNRPRRVPKTMFKELLKIWHSDDHKRISEKNTMNRLEGKKKNIMHTAGPKSFARVREDWKKERNTTKNPTLAEMFIATRKEKRTKHKSGDPRDKLIRGLNASSSQSTSTIDKENVVAAMFNSKNKKKCGFPLHGRGVSNTLLKQKVMLEEIQKKHDEKMEALQKDYEDKRQQDNKMKFVHGFRSFFSQFHQGPDTIVDLTMLNFLLQDDRSQNELLVMLQQNEQGIINMERGNDEDEDDDDEDIDD